MNVDYFFQTTFALIQDPEDKKFQRCVNNPEWWEQRYEILENYFIPTLDQQEFQDFERIVNFETVSERYDSKQEVIDLLDENGFHISFVESNHPTNWPTAYSMLDGRSDADWVVNYEGDSDDCLSPKALQFIKDKEDEIEEGRVFAFKRGYISDFQGEKIGVYEHDSSQFYAKVYPKEVLKNSESFRNYSEKHSFHSGHPSLLNGGKLIHLPDFHFVHTAHGFQHSSGWEDHHTMKHVTDWIENEEEKERIREKFNLE